MGLFHIVEKGDTLRIIKKKTEWYKVIVARDVTGWENEDQLAKTLTIKTIQLLRETIKGIPSVEEVQDVVEEVLLNSASIHSSSKIVKSARPLVMG